MDRVTALRQISITAQCYSSILFIRQQENSSLRREGMSIQRQEEKSTPACRRQRERDSFDSFLYMPHPGPVLCKLGQPGVLFVLPEVLTPVLGPSFVLFSGLFPSLAFSHRHFGLFFPPPGQPCANWAQPGVLLKSSLWSSDLPLTFLVFQPPPFWTLFPYSTYRKFSRRSN